MLAESDDGASSTRALNPLGDPTLRVEEI